MPPIPFGEWRPDAPDLSETAREALNVIPEQEGYRPFKALATTTNALGARAQGAAWFRAPNGTTKVFSGDASKLYLLSASAWGDVSRTIGGAYTTDGTGNWRFVQFKGTAYATNGVDVLQSFDLNSGGELAGRGRLAARRKFIGVVRNFLVIANVSGSPQLVKWSGRINSTTWTPSATTLSDEQDQPDGGEITGFVGGEFGLVFQEAAIAGCPLRVARRFSASTRSRRIWAPRSRIRSPGGGNIAFFCHRSGFHMVVGGQQITHIGKNRVDRWFWGPRPVEYASSPARSIRSILYTS